MKQLFIVSINGEDVNNSLIMIQPTLMSYQMDAPPQPAFLDPRSIRPVLLLDTYFYILIFHGSTIAQCDAGYQGYDGYESLRELLAVPKVDARDISFGRSIIPKYIVCDQGDNEAQFLLSKLIPSTAQSSGEDYSTDGLTDDAGLQEFMDHLKK